MKLIVLHKHSNTHTCQTPNIRGGFIFPKQNTPLGANVTSVLMEGAEKDAMQVPNVLINR